MTSDLGRRPFFWTGSFVVGLGFLTGVEVLGQEVALPASGLPPAEVAAELLMREPRLGLFKLGPFDVTPRASTSVYYDDNVNTRPDKESDVVVAVSPGISAVALDMAEGVGKRMTIDFTPTFLFYTQGRRGDEVTYDALLAGSLLFPRLTLGFSQSVRLTADPDVDVAGRSQLTLYRTGLTSRYALGEKTSVEVNGSFLVADYDSDTLTDYQDITSLNWFNYQYGPRLGLGMGVVVGYLAIDDFPDQTYQQALGRVVYAVAEKVDVSASGGAEWRQFKSDIDTAVNPVWTITGVYRPMDSTTLRGELYQVYANSASFGNQNYLRTGVRLVLRQRVYRRLSLSASGGYYRSEYETTVPGVTAATRDDDVFVARLGLDTRLGQQWTVGVFYDYFNSKSTLAAYDYDRHRFGARVAWSY